VIAFNVPGGYNKNMRAITLRESIWVRKSFWTKIIDVTLVGVVSLLSVGIGTILSTILLNGVN
jgi:hypothetical protein